MATQIAKPSVVLQPVGRLAPSPTGCLHLGNARSFLLAWLSIRQQRGSLILRDEDIDAARAKPGAVASLIDDLRWLGLDWDAGPDIPPGRIGSVSMVQSERLERYRQVLQQLMADRRVYCCRCTRSQIVEAAASAPHEPAWTWPEAPIYPGTCRPKGDTPILEPVLVPNGQQALRWAFQSGIVRWHDHLLGAQSADPKRRLGDFVIGRTSGLPAYQLAVVVDDYDMGVTEVVRGSDLALSTYRQLAILQHFGWPIPRYYHVPLVLSADGQRMAKRRGDSLGQFRQQGVAPETIIGYLAFSLGLIDRFEKVAPHELIGRLDWDRISAEPTTFTGSFQ